MSRSRTVTERSFCEIREETLKGALMQTLIDVIVENDNPLCQALDKYIL